MKKIGFVDYFIDEWHSNNYIPWIKKICEEKGYEFEVKYAWAEADEYEGKISTDAWCEKMGVEKCSSIEELCNKSDYIMILAPGNPEKHLAYAEEVLKFKKNTYIDKTFAPDLDTAKKIFALSEKYGTKFFSTSALRYGTELEPLKGNTKSIITKGGGGSFEEYVIHQIEMLVSVMGSGAEEVMMQKSSRQQVATVKYEDGRKGFITYSPSAHFCIDAEDLDSKTCFKPITSDYFLILLETILKFFENGELPFDSKQTLDVIAIRDALLKAGEKTETWVKVEK